MQFGKSTKRWFFVSLISLGASMLCLVIKMAGFFQEAAVIVAALSFVFFLSAVATTMLAMEFDTTTIFEHLFGFDPRPNKRDLIVNPQKNVSAVIEQKRIRAHEFFRRENDLLTEEKPIPSSLFFEKSRAKKGFWKAVEIAADWGFRVPKSINESAFPPAADAAADADTNHLIGGVPGLHNTP